MKVIMTQDREREIAERFGRMVRNHRVEAGLTQESLALATDVGRRFIVELEKGKPTCQIGKALLVAEAVGVEFPKIAPAVLPDLPDYVEDDDEDAQDDGGGLRLHEYTRLHSKT